MTSFGILQIAVYFLLILVLTKPVGLFMARLFEGERTFLHPVLRPVEQSIYKLCGVEEKAEQRWTQYAASLQAFSAVSFVFAYIIQRIQAYLPLNPQNFGTPVMTPDLAFNTAASFITNTNWQAYAGESTMSYFVQMTVLTVQNFVSAAAGVACAIAVIRGFSRQQANSIGNFWVDLTRATLYIFLPISIVFALFLCSQGGDPKLRLIQDRSRPWKARPKPSRWDLLLLRRRSKWWAPTAADPFKRQLGSPIRKSDSTH